MKLEHKKYRNVRNGD